MFVKVYKDIENKYFSVWELCILINKREITSEKNHEHLTYLYMISFPVMFFNVMIFVL